MNGTIIRKNVLGTKSTLHTWYDRMKEEYLLLVRVHSMGWSEAVPIVQIVDFSFVHEIAKA